MRATVRLLIALIVGLGASLLWPGSVGWYLRGLVGWDCGALTLVTLGWWVIGRSNQHDTCTWAAAEDPGRREVWLLALGASLFSLFAAIGVMRHIQSFQPQEALFWSGMAVLAIMLSWTMTHTACTLHYAHLHYTDKIEDRLCFPGSELPTHLDFAYFSFTVGMCYQVSDVTVEGSDIRRDVFAHSLLSFVYNTVVVALALNIMMHFVG